MQIVGDLGHSLSHVVDVGFQAQVLLHFLAKFYNISFCRQNLLDVADTFILNFECLIYTLEGKLNDILDVGPLRIGL